MANKRSKVGSLRELPAWQALISETDPHQRYGRFQDLCAAVKSEHVKELQTWRDGGNDDEKRWGYNVLAELATAGDDRVPQDVRSEVIEALRKVGRTEYGRTPRGNGAIDRLKRLGAGEVNAVLEAQDVASLTDEARSRFARDTVLAARSPRILEQLRIIQKLGGAAGRQAEIRLESLGEVDMRAVRALAKKWKEGRSTEALLATYHRYIVNQVGKIKISDIVKMLGRPDKREGNRIWYVPNDWSSLYLEGDAKGILRAMKLTD